VAQTNGAGVVAALSGGVPIHSLQLVGDGLVIALAAGVDGAVELSRDCAKALRERFWEGDEELAAELDRVLAGDPESQLQPIPVDLEDLADVLEGELGGEPGAVDLITGEVWPAPALDYAEETDQDDAPDLEDAARWLVVGPDGSSEGYRDMVDFIATVREPDVAGRLDAAIDGRGAFGRFRRALDAYPNIEDRWHRFSADRRRGRARTWLADQGYRSVARPGGLRAVPP
jgi:hypothetical protein